MTRPATDREARLAEAMRDYARCWLEVTAEMGEEVPRQDEWDNMIGSSAALLTQPTPEPCRAPEGWRPIAEAPRDGTLILLFIPADDLCEACQTVGRWDARWEVWAADDYDALREPSHFRPLHDPPAGEK